MTLKEQIQDKLNVLSGDTILIHSDIMHGFDIPYRSREDLLISHFQEVRSLCENLSIWMPTFNYDFCKGNKYIIKDTPSQVGVLSEYYRKNIAEWRTQIPVFSFSGTGKEPKIDITNIVDPFGTLSAFQVLYERDALLMHYGSAFKTSTLLHYAERISNQLLYRYDKLFYGQVLPINGKEIDVTFNFHVRPLGKHLDYDWNNIENDLFDNNILFLFEEGQSRILLCKIKKLIDYWIERMTHNPLYLLDNDSKIWVEPLLDTLDRPFLITDFE